MTVSPFVGSLVFHDLFEEDLDCNNNVRVIGGSSPKGELAKPASPTHVPMEWKLVSVDVHSMKLFYAFLPKPCKYTEY